MSRMEPANASGPLRRQPGDGELGRELAAVGAQAVDLDAPAAQRSASVASACASPSRHASRCACGTMTSTISRPVTTAASMPNMSSAERLKPVIAALGVDGDDRVQRALEHPAHARLAGRAARGPSAPGRRPGRPAADAGQRVEQVLVGLDALVVEGLDHADRAVAGDEREGERADEPGRPRDPRPVAVDRRRCRRRSPRARRRTRGPPAPRPARRAAGAWRPRTRPARRRRPATPGPATAVPERAGHPEHARRPAEHPADHRHRDP